MYLQNQSKYFKFLFRNILYFLIFLPPFKYYTSYEIVHHFIINIIIFISNKKCQANNSSHQYKNHFHSLPQTICLEIIQAHPIKFSPWSLYSSRTILPLVHLHLPQMLYIPVFTPNNSLHAPFIFITHPGPPISQPLTTDNNKCDQNQNSLRKQLRDKEEKENKTENKILEKYSLVDIALKIKITLNDQWSMENLNYLNL